MILVNPMPVGIGHMLTWLFLPIVLPVVSGCNGPAEKREVCAEQLILCHLNDNIVIYCNQTYLWIYPSPGLKAEGGTENCKRQTFRGIVPGEYFQLIKRQVAVNKQFVLVDGIPTCFYSESDSFTPLPEGVGEFLGFLWQVHSRRIKGQEPVDMAEMDSLVNDSKFPFNLPTE